LRKLGVYVILVAIALILLSAFLGNTFITVPAGHRGVVLNWGAVSETIFDEGLHLVMPVMTHVVNVSIRNQAYEARAEAASQDLQVVNTSITLNYSALPEKVARIYQTLGQEYAATVIKPAIQETVKAITVKHNAEDLIKERSIVKNEIQDVLSSRLAEYGIKVETVSITNFEFSKAFSDSIEAKMVALQRALEAENKLRQIEVEARQAEAMAKGLANAAVVEAEGKAKAMAILAEAEANANSRISSSLNAMINQYRLIDKLAENAKVIIVPSGGSFILGSDLLK